MAKIGYKHYNCYSWVNGNKWLMSSRISYDESSTRGSDVAFAMLVSVSISCIRKSHPGR